MPTEHSAAHVVDPVAVRVLLAVPELAARYLALTEALDDDPGGIAVLSELADLVAGHLAPSAGGAPLLDRVFAVVEALALDAPDPEELVGWAFLDALSPDELARARPHLGPATRALLDALDGGGAGGESGGGGGDAGESSGDAGESGGGAGESGGESGGGAGESGGESGGGGGGGGESDGESDGESGGRDAVTGS